MPDSMIRIEGFTQRFGKFEAVKHLDLELGEGEIFGFIGPNGAGKTTTIRMLATLLVPSEGDAFIDGHSVMGQPAEVRRLVGYMPDIFGVYASVRVWEYLDFFARAFKIRAHVRKKVIDDVLEITDLVAKRDALVDELSKGMRQRLCLAKTLVHDPQVLLLDEPAAGLDPRARIEIRALLKELGRMGKTIFISSHILTELSDLCTSIGVIEKGEMIVSGDMETMTAKIGASRSVELRVMDTELVLALLSQDRRVTNIDKENDEKVAFDFAGDREDLCELVSTMVRRGVKLYGLVESKSGLEDVFMEVTKGIVT